MKPILNPTDVQMAKLMSLPADQAVSVLNLFEFNKTAEYQPGDPEYGTDAANVSGEEAFQRYSETAGKSIDDVGGRVAMSAPVDQVLIGGSDMAWDVAAIMFFPTRGDFMKMMANPDFQQASRHRKAALANHQMIHLRGDVFNV